MFADELPMPRGHAAKVLRPRPVDRAVDDDVSDLPGAELLSVRRKCEVGVDLSLREQALAFGGGMLGEGDVLVWIEPHMGKHAGEEDVRGLTQLGDRDRLTLQIPDHADPVRPEQLETAWVHTAQDRDGVAGVQPHDQWRDEVQGDIDLPRCQGVRYTRRGHLDVLDVAEPLGLQEFSDDVLGGRTDARRLIEPQSRRLRRRLPGGVSGCPAEQPYRSRDTAQEGASGYHPLSSLRH